MYAKFLLDVACQKLLKSANVSRSYSKNKSGFLFWNTVYKHMPTYATCHNVSANPTTYFQHEKLTYFTDHRRQKGSN